VTKAAITTKSKLEGIKMTTKPDLPISNADEPDTSITLSAQPKREIYPQVNDRIKGAVMWLGFVFVAMVIFVQYFSGYS
jgi:hypothetical protein